MEFYQNKKRKEAYQGPFSYDKITKTIKNNKNQSILYVHLSHPMEVFDEDRDAFGEKLIDLLNKNL